MIKKKIKKMLNEEAAIIKKDEKKKIEEDLHSLLTEGDLEQQNIGEKVINNLIPRHEIRVRAEKDPIKEETELVQKTVVETNERYLKYVDNEGNEGNLDKKDE